MRRDTIKKNSVRVVRLRELMHDEHLTQCQLAEKLNMTQQNLSRIIRTEKISDSLVSDIWELFPEYSLDWLKGVDMDIIDRIKTAFNPIALKSSGTAQLIQSLGYTITRNEDRVTLQSETDTLEMSEYMYSRIQNDLCDYLEYKISKMLS